MATVELLITEYSIQTWAQTKLKLKESKKVNSKEASLMVMEENLVFLQTEDASLDSGKKERQMVNLKSMTLMDMLKNKVFLVGMIA